MKKLFVSILFFILIMLPSYAFDINEIGIRTASKDGQGFVFTYHIPDEEDNNEKVSDDLKTENNKTEEQEISRDIISDDVTADTSGNPYNNENEDLYALEDMYSDVLQGYAEYEEYYDRDGVELEIKDNLYASLNIKNPVKIEGKKYTSLNSTPSLFTNKYSKYNVPEFSIATIYQEHQGNLGKGFSAGTTYWQGISDGELEQSSGLFSRYEYKRIAMTTTYLKTINSTNNDYTDNLLFTPELKISQYLTLKEILTTNIVTGRKKTELMLSINPFGNKDTDRLRFNIGAVQFWGENNDHLKNQFKFYTNYKF